MKTLNVKHSSQSNSSLKFTSLRERFKNIIRILLNEHRLCVEWAAILFVVALTKAICISYHLQRKNCFKIRYVPNNILNLQVLTILLVGDEQKL